MADEKLPKLVPSQVAQSIEGQSFIASQKKKEVVSAFHSWSICMKSKGYNYKKPLDASDDHRFSNPYRITKLEKRTAIADVACREKVNLEKTWFDSEAKIEQSAIAKQISVLKSVPSQYAALVSKAQSIE